VPLMSLHKNDLRYTVLKKLSIDEFEPKTGDSEDVLVLGFFTREQNASADIKEFINGSHIQPRDVEVSPNTNSDGYYMVFVELDRDQSVLDKIQALIHDVENLTGKLQWQARTHLMDHYIQLGDPELSRYVITDPKKYMSREEFDRQQAEILAQEQAIAEQRAAEAIALKNSNNVLEFLKSSNLLQAGIRENQLHMQDARNVVSLEFVDFGPGEQLLTEYGIKESAIKDDFDKTLFGKLKSMLGDMAALPIDNYIVIYHPADQTNVLIAREI
jgi:hypothetical protein